MSNLEIPATEPIRRTLNAKDAPAVIDASSTSPTAYDPAVSSMIQNVRIATYRKRKSYNFPWLRPGYMMQFQEIERAVLRAVSRHFQGSLAGLKLLDIGCGNGGWIRRFVNWGVRPESIFGIDAIEERIAEARRLIPPGVTLICGNAAALQFGDESFDLVVLFECLCIMTDRATRTRMASEALRVLRPTGAILFYDFRYRRPGLGDVLRPVHKHEIKELFPGCDFHLRSIHPFPPLSRKLAAITPAAWHLLNVLPPIRTSYVGAIRKRSSR